jgi:gluconokinase
MVARKKPLNDEDRWDWLIALRATAVERLKGGARGVIVVCSALKKSYRDIFRGASLGDVSVRVHFLYMRVDEHILLERLNQRQDHPMKADMLGSGAVGHRKRRCDNRGRRTVD